MNAVPFDTLKLARDLEAAGVAAPAAAGSASALADALIGADLATKSDLAHVESGLKTEIAQVEARLRTQIAQSEGRVMAAIHAVKSETALLDSRLTGAINALVTALTGSEARFDAKLELLRRDMTIKLGGMMFIAVGVILAAMRFMPHP